MNSNTTKGMFEIEHYSVGVAAGSPGLVAGSAVADRVSLFVYEMLSRTDALGLGDRNGNLGLR